MNRVTKKMKKNKDVLEELVGRENLSKVLIKGKKAKKNQLLRTYVRSLKYIFRQKPVRLKLQNQRLRGSRDRNI